MTIELSTEQAKAGYEVLERYNNSRNFQLRGVASGVAARWGDGEEFENAVASKLRQVVTWYAKASGALYPKSPEVVRFCREFIEACEVELPEPSARLGHGSGGV